MATQDTAERRATELQAKCDRQGAIALLMDSYGVELYRYCLSVLHDHEQAEDALQESFINAFNRLDSFNGDSTWRTWLYSIARNRCLDDRKKASRLAQRVRFSDEIPEVEHEPQLADPALSEAIRRCISTLAPAVRRSVLMRVVGEYSYAECQQVLGADAGTLQARVARALPKLRRCLAESGVTP